MTRYVHAFSLLPLIWLSACSDSAGDGQPVGTVEIGTGLRPMSFEALPSDPSLAIEPGLQGGYHVQIALRTEDISPEGVAMDLSIESDDGQPIGGANYVDDFFTDASGRAFYGGVTVFLENDIDPETVSGRLLRLRAEISDERGASAVGDLTFRAEWDGSTPLDL
ncbi:MAG: hypothetical protein ACI81R_002818 [Bradymonadia bacterium]|jgi:hypothetical protein